jgi:class 3 adenylate cyclase
VEAGDAAWRDTLAAFYAVIERQLAMHDGREVDRAGDGVLAIFDGPTRAIMCARAIQGEVAGLALTLGGGVHTGEVEQDGAAFRGIALHVAARVCATATPGEILVSSTVRDLSAGSSITFADRGSHQLKGVPERRRLYAVVG